MSDKREEACLASTFSTELTGDEWLDALGEFLQAFEGPPKSDAPDVDLDNVTAPLVLQHFYRMASARPSLWGKQDFLRRPEKLHALDDGRLIFLDENQGGWCCVTLPDGEDPPVWCENQLANIEGTEPWVRVADSLGRFLVEFALTNVPISAASYWGDSFPLDHVTRDDDELEPLLLGCKYAYPSSPTDFYVLQGSVVVGTNSESSFLAANDADGVDFVAAYAPMRLRIGREWCVGDSSKLERVVDDNWRPSANIAVERHRIDVLYAMMNDEGQATLLYRNDRSGEELVSFNEDAVGSVEEHVFQLEGDEYVAPESQVIPVEEAAGIVLRYLESAALDDLAAPDYDD